MKKTGLNILLALLIVSFITVKANALEPNNVVLSYVNALKNGNIEIIKDSIAGEMYKKRKVLLEQNEYYSEFLKKFYLNANFQIKETIVEDNNVLVYVEVDFPDTKTNFTLLLKKDVSGNWKIFKEISD